MTLQSTNNFNCADNTSPLIQYCLPRDNSSVDLKHMSSILFNYEELNNIHKAIECSSYNKGKKSKQKTSDNQDSSMSVSSLNGGVFRPRGALARTLYEKHQNDCKLREVNKADWYRCDMSDFAETVRGRFLELSPDDETRNFISNAIEKSSWVWTQIWHCIAKSFLGFFMTRTDINGWLGRGSMFVVSQQQLAQLLEAAKFRKQGEVRQGSLIDVGAGDGEVSKGWGELFTRLYATEMSSSMRKLLETKGFRVLGTERWWVEENFDVICMLNLLDRCSKPDTMMRHAVQAMNPGGIIIVALVLPFKPYVEYESNHQPSEQLPIRGDTFEEQVESFVDYAELAVGLELLVWTKVPYLCEGDINQSYYWLNDALFIFKKNFHFVQYSR